MKNERIVATLILSIAIVLSAWMISQNRRWAWVDIGSGVVILDTHTGTVCAAIVEEGGTVDLEARTTVRVCRDITDVDGN